MSKISIKTELKSKNQHHLFEGKGLKNGQKITYSDAGIMTTITLGEIIYLERKKDYYMKIGFYKSKTLNGTYIISEGTMNIKTKTKNVIRQKDFIKIWYSLYINDTYIDDFELNLRYSIDT